MVSGVYFSFNFCQPLGGCSQSYAVHSLVFEERYCKPRLIFVTSTSTFCLLYRSLKIISSYCRFLTLIL